MENGLLDPEKRVMVTPRLFSPLYSPCVDQDKNSSDSDKELMGSLKDGAKY